MKRIFLFLGTLAISGLYAQQTQVGINTVAPKATLDIRANPNAVAGTNEGILIPRLSKEKVAQMTAPETSTLVYVNDVSFTTTEPKVANITKVGFYHYNGTRWIAGLGDDTNIYAQNGTLTENRTVGMNGKNLLFTGNGNVGIGTNAPLAKLDVLGNAKASQFHSYSLVSNTNLHPAVINLGATGGTFENPAYVKKGNTLGAFVSRDLRSNKEAAVVNSLFYGGSEIYAFATEDFSATNKGSNLMFKTTQNGKVQSELRMLIDHNGNVGIGTSTPTVTLDVKGTPSRTDMLDGLMMPKLTGDQLSYKTYTPTEQGTLVYVTAPASPARRIGQTQNVTAVGYYSFDGTRWVNSGIVASSPPAGVIGSGVNYPRTTYFCNASNLGQVLISVEGYFVCVANPSNNNGLDGPYGWSYTGVAYNSIIEGPVIYANGLYNSTLPEPLGGGWEIPRGKPAHISSPGVATLFQTSSEKHTAKVLIKP